MTTIPRLYTPRLCLRPFEPEDAPRVQDLASDRRIAATTAHIPHPYPAGAAAAWIQTHRFAAEQNRQFTFAITLAGTRSPGREHDLTDTGYVIGAIALGLDKNPANARAELGYWIGANFWNKGFATEAARALFDFAFTRLHLHRVSASHFSHNPASGRVMQKLGMTKEGTLRSHEEKYGSFHDLDLYGITADEWQTLAHKPQKPAQKSQFVTRYSGAVLA